MEKVYQSETQRVKGNEELSQSVNGRTHALPDPDSLVNHLRLHPALARRKDVSKGAREVFAWIMALALVHRRDDPTTTWLALATGDSERQVARSLAELEDLAVIRVLGDGHNRRLRIAESMSPAKDAVGNRDKNDKVPVGNRDGDDMVADGNHDENVIDKSGNRDGCGKVPSGNHDKNGRDSRGRVGLSESQKESKSSDSETQSLAFSKTLSEEGRKKAQDAWELFQEHPKNGAVREYEGLLSRCAGREECFDLAVLQARTAQDGKTLQIPVAYIRRIMTTRLQEDKDATRALLEQAQYEYETPAQRREIDARVRQAQADKAAHQAPPAPEVAEMLGQAAKRMPGGERAEDGEHKWSPPPAPRSGAIAPPTQAEAAALERVQGMTAFDADQVRGLAQLAARAADPATERLLSGNPARKALLRRHLPAALAQWDQEQAAQPKKLSREELREAIKNKKLVRTDTSPPAEAVVAAVN